MSKRSTKLAFESLEARENPSSYVDGAGNLIIVGTDAADSVTVSYVAGSSSPYYVSLPKLNVVENGVTTSHTAWWVTGRIYFYGYGGDDYFNNYANSWAVTAYGMNGNDSLLGYGQADYLDGGAGNDYLYGYGGNDTLIGGDGNDRLYGMDGNDWIEGQNGSDYIDGGAGNDTLLGAWNGWAGEAGGANDTIYGGTGNDLVYGGDGDDSLYGGDGEDWMEGEAGNDFLQGNAGADHMGGGDGFDRYQDDFYLNSPFYWQRAEAVVQQGAPTCQTLASIAAARLAGHDFSNQITSLGNNTWRVRVYPNGVATDVNVTFDGTWSDTDPSPASDSNGRLIPEFWTILLQRARLATFGVYDNNEMTASRWSALNTTFNQRPQNASDAILTLTGRRATHTAIGSVTWDMLSASLQRRNIMTAYGNGHVWAIRDVYVDVTTNTRIIRLYNPYGYDQYMTYDTFRVNFQGVEIG